jgi:hypothetical protein
LSDPDRTAAAKTPQKAPELLVVSSGPVTLDIRPLSEYQQTLISTVLSLRSQGWTDRQIAIHFNETGYLTPRGHRWLPQSVFSMRKKYQIRLERIGEIH